MVVSAREYLYFWDTHSMEPIQDPTPYAGDGWLNLQKDGPQEQRGTRFFRGHTLPATNSSPTEDQRKGAMFVLGSVFPIKCWASFEHGVEDVLSSEICHELTAIILTFMNASNVRSKLLLHFRILHYSSSIYTLFPPCFTYHQQSSILTLQCLP